MNWFIILPTVIVCICVLILITKISIKLKALYTPAGQDITVQVRVWFIRYTFDLLEVLEKKRKRDTRKPVHDKFADEKPEEELNRALSYWTEKLPALIKSMGDIHTIGKDFLRKIKVRRFRWQSHLGTGDAASTGILAGYAWSVKGLVIGFISHYMRLVQAPSIEIVPVFQGKLVTTELECIVSFRIGQVFFTALKLFRYVQKNRNLFVDKAATDIRG